MTVTKQGEQITVYTPQVRRRFLIRLIALVAIVAAFFAINVHNWIENHHSQGGAGSLWSDPAFIQHVRDEAVFNFFLALLYGSSGWWMFVSVQGCGSTTFHRDTQSVRSGRRQYHVHSVFVRGQPSISRRAFVVSFRTKSPKKFEIIEWPLVLNFRQPENAGRMAQIIGEFLAVPVQNEITGTGG